MGNKPIDHENVTLLQEDNSVNIQGRIMVL